MSYTVLCFIRYKDFLYIIFYEKNTSVLKNISQSGLRIAFRTSLKSSEGTHKNPYVKIPYRTKKKLAYQA